MSDPRWLRPLAGKFDHGNLAASAAGGRREVDCAAFVSVGTSKAGGDQESADACWVLGFTGAEAVITNGPTKLLEEASVAGTWRTVAVSARTKACTVSSTRTLRQYDKHSDHEIFTLRIQ